MVGVKTILLQTVLLFAVVTQPALAQTTNEDFLKKPHVLPSAERAYHAIYHELDTKMEGGAKQTGMFGQLYVALIEDQFTFGGDLDEWPKTLFKNDNKGCKPFMGANVDHKCDHAYFLVHQDMVKLVKTTFDKGGKAEDPSLDKVCASANESGFIPEQDPDRLVYRYGHRVLMTYKPDVNHNKCIGTYDTRTDTFTCMKYVAGQPKLVPFELQNFLWSEDTGHFARGTGNIEVFCKQLHYKPEKSPTTPK
ncbi:hypothetical protein GCK72_016276 [Caenorhabditis remanei]|uniref:Uncharacterized protein n=1 Tax=Caenorhabditis remanei TaxID=31234 RepID=A0A6A5GYP2_CAERE|nr:hypothetical protein GCK72_016276 [Caenorhabditis remanei]KAF1759809.1 hypothetical protein GCK72_016276 [Caenorhabditis remanei]